MRHRRWSGVSYSYDDSPPRKPRFYFFEPLGVPANHALEGSYSSGNEPFGLLEGRPHGDRHLPEAKPMLIPEHDRGALAGREGGEECLDGEGSHNGVFNTVPALEVV